MNESVKSVRKLLASAELFGFETAGWGAERIAGAGRRTAGRRGAKGVTGDGAWMDEELLQELNGTPPTDVAAAEPAERADDDEAAA